MVLVIGAALTPFNRRRDGSGFRDWAAQAFSDALVMAGLEPGDIDALIVSSESDFFTLQLNPASVIAQDIGLCGAETLRVEGGGGSGQYAVHVGVERILSGRAQRVAVMGVDPSASVLDGDSIRELYGYSFDFWTDGLSGITATGLYALSWQAFAAEYGAAGTDLDRVATKNRCNACENPGAHLPRKHTAEEFEASRVIASPYKRLHCSPLSDGAAALILSAREAAPAVRQTRAPAITGIGAASDLPGLGHRKSLCRFEAKSLAAKRAYEMAGISASAIDLAEVYDAYAGAELQAIAALGLSADPVAALREGRFDADGACPINLSGGLIGQGAPVGATGVGQAATCALLLEGRYHKGLQPERPLGHALADTHGGVGTSCAVTVLRAGGQA
ncbi:MULTISPECIES: thiolase family protein [unclassified Ruegeria]|uniref:thiolase family protein n=1 Tax=unclassified Ruegeria TaxID=2625375 RepID=UPI0014879D22|nr:MULTISPECIES: thiolase family protein [unclassified Ruegeria]